jgi:hypothetical protein
VESLIHPVGSFLHAGDSGFHPTSGFIVISEGLDHDVIMQQQLAVRMNLVLLIATAQQLCFRMLIVGSIMVGGGVHDAAR